eukprot:6185327-Pleurochrysis_carterae.AAC.3
MERLAEAISSRCQRRRSWRRSCPSACAPAARSAGRRVWAHGARRQDGPHCAPSAVSAHNLASRDASTKRIEPEAHLVDVDVDLKKLTAFLTSRRRRSWQAYISRQHGI